MSEKYKPTQEEILHAEEMVGQVNPEEQKLSEVLDNAVENIVATYKAKLGELTVREIIESFRDSTKENYRVLSFETRGHEVVISHVLHGNMDYRVTVDNEVLSKDNAESVRNKYEDVLLTIRQELDLDKHKEVIKKKAVSDLLN